MLFKIVIFSVQYLMKMIHSSYRCDDFFEWFEQIIIERWWWNIISKKLIQNLYLFNSNRWVSWLYVKWNIFRKSPIHWNIFLNSIKHYGTETECCNIVTHSLIIKRILIDTPSFVTNKLGLVIYIIKSFLNAYKKAFFSERKVFSMSWRGVLESHEQCFRIS